jgi:hypothetical protein
LRMPVHGQPRMSSTTHRAVWLRCSRQQGIRRLPHRVGHDSKVLFVGRNLLANGRGRWLALAVSLVVAAAMVYAQGTEKPSRVEVPAAAPTTHGSAPAGAPTIASPTEAELLAASAPVAAPNFQFALPAGVAPEDRLQVHTIRVARAISVMFPEITTIGGYRRSM